ncbi:nucleotidyl transferase AbiEii/AbiGii toxin family protein [Vulgatibacter sp.]|uniref:nucleotidyl transferase AbiEii/AbiGii toxin family protein n=1 Tax=Vulgatibacter sp. TaxID=1971226 RepID=UPI0035651864
MGFRKRSLLHADYRVRISTREDIVAEKLRALLQQVLRDRYRCQDVLDLAVMLRGGAELDTGKVAKFLLEKAAARDVPVSRTAFHGPELAARARVDYEALESTARHEFIYFDDALARVLEFVDRLGLGG